jgi:hypothetical protein
MSIKTLGNAFVSQLQVLRDNPSIATKPEIVEALNGLAADANEYLSLTEGEIAREKDEETQRRSSLEEILAETISDDAGVTVVVSEPDSGDDSTQEKDQTLLSILLYAHADNLSKKTKKVVALVKKALSKPEESNFDWTDLKLKLARAAYHGQELAGKVKESAGSPLAAFETLKSDPQVQEAFQSLGLDKLFGFAQGLLPNLEEIKSQFQKDGQQGLVGAAAAATFEKVLATVIPNGGAYLLRKGNEVVGYWDAKIALAVAESLPAQCDAFVAAAQYQLLREQLASKLSLLEASVNNPTLVGVAQALASRFAGPLVQKAAATVFNSVANKIKIGGMPASDLVSALEQMFASEVSSKPQAPADDQPQPNDDSGTCCQSPDGAGDADNNQPPPASPEDAGSPPAPPTDQTSNS